MKTNFLLKAFLCFISCFPFLFATYSGIYINEISGNEKWLEIYNSADEAVDISKYVILKIDEAGLYNEWQIPAGTVISARGFLSWQRDKDNTDGSTFTWGISAKKDVAFELYDKNQKKIDYFEVKSDLYSEGFFRTVGRETDGADKLVIFTNGGTKNASNNNGTKQEPTANPKKIFINEINGNRYNAAGEMQEKWLEIYNAEDAPVDISNFYVQKINEKGSVNNWFIPEGTVIDAKGFRVWEQDSLDTEGLTFTWGISARKDLTLRIFDFNGTMLDEFIVDADEGDKLYSEGEGRTVGRKYDGADEVIVFANNGTKGVSNSSSPGNSDETISFDTVWAYSASKTLYLSERVKTLVVYSITGNLILNGQTELANKEINLHYLPDGIYLLKMTDGNNQEKIQKIVLKN
ncbi:T9SS C-terminal target domain-containing protein [Paludibacter sp. 221]|uniref:lamin tail domain-containing protein n=1 Tax=Paludibacter sp. 221 TaxID=2302939 RepID=UPI0013D82C96|nr:lamin tail domain-containing protein [Paludibacter sp. 221]NDV47082.1 T9SS C-terminal target domain-containing protein [Paludibacter sp. 221]